MDPDDATAAKRSPFLLSQRHRSHSFYNERRTDHWPGVSAAAPPLGWVGTQEPLWEGPPGMPWVSSWFSQGLGQGWPDSAQGVEDDGCGPSCFRHRAPCGVQLFPTVDSPAELLLGGGPAGAPNVWVSLRPRHGEGIVVCVSVALIFCGGCYGATPPMNYSACLWSSRGQDPSSRFMAQHLG